MKGRRAWLFILAALLAAVVLGLAACGGDDDEEAAGDTTAAAEKDSVTLQLKWVTQAQFAGYYAALEPRRHDQARRSRHHA
jgi:NitT/TauT family transport system substrate-binding protein